MGNSQLGQMMVKLAAEQGCTIVNMVSNMMVMMVSDMTSNMIVMLVEPATSVSMPR